MMSMGGCCFPRGMPGLVCVASIVLAQLFAGGARAEEPPRLEARRFAENPLLRPDMLPGRDGENINGPSVLRVPAWLRNPLGTYYLYFAHHSGAYIRLAYSDNLTGPWKIHGGGVLKLKEAAGCTGHIASPDVVADEEHHQIRMYFHGPAKEGRGQQSFVALADDGLNFKASAEPLGSFYFRVIQWRGWWYAMSKGGQLYRSPDGLRNFEKGPNPLPGGETRKEPFNGPGPRHVALHLLGDVLWVYYSSIGDAPERVKRCRVELTDDWRGWKAGPEEEVLRPQTDYEGANLPLQKSNAGAARGRENALRDPAIFMDTDGKVYLFYSVAGEVGIGGAQILGSTTEPAPRTTR